MKLYELRVFATQQVLTDDTTSEVKKSKILKYLNSEADETQCMGYILNKKLYNFKNNEFGKIEIQEQFEDLCENFQVLQEKDGYHPIRKTAVAHVFGPTGRIAMATMGGVALARNAKKAGIKGAGKMGLKAGAKGAALSVGTWGVYRLIRSAFDTCTKQCGTFKINNPKRQLCLFKCKEVKLQKEIAALTKAGEDQYKIDKLKQRLAKVKITVARYGANH